MIELIITGTLLIFICHFVFDYICQDVDWAEKKSYDNRSLLKHTSVYSGLWVLPIFPLLGLGSTILFIIITFITHTATDYCTSKVFKEMIKAKNYSEPIPNLGAFTVLGFDQLLHYLQLYITFLILAL